MIAILAAAAVMIPCDTPNVPQKNLPEFCRTGIMGSLSSPIPAGANVIGNIDDPLTPSQEAYRRNPAAFCDGMWAVELARDSSMVPDTVSISSRWSKISCPRPAWVIKPPVEKDIGTPHPQDGCSLQGSLMACPAFLQNLPAGKNYP